MRTTDPIIAQEALELMKECEHNTMLFAHMIFPNRFRLRFSDIHRQIFHVLDDDSKKKVLIIAPRGIGKTSIVQLAFPAKRILFGDSKYIASVSHSATNAVIQTEALKEELLTNPMIVKLWGSLKGDWFTKEHWKTDTGTMIIPRGSGQQIRGLLGGDYRPDTIIIDDLEDKDEVMNEDNRIKTKRYVFEDAMNAVDEAEAYRVIVIGSLLHQDSLLANIQDMAEADIKAGKEPEWTVLNLSICDENYNSYWPEKYSNTWILKKMEEYAKLGMLDSFAQEFMGLITSGKENFTKDLFQRYDDDALTLVERDALASVVIIDPAKTSKTGSCFYAITGCGIDVANQKYLVRDIDKGHYTPDELHSHAFYMARKLDAHVIAVEVTGLEDHIMYPLKNEMIRRGYNFEFVELKAGRDTKIERTRLGLLPLYKRKQVYHNDRIAHLIEIPLLSYPRCREWDVIDTLSYLPQVMEKGERYLQRAGMRTFEREDAALERLRREDIRNARPLRRVNAA
jgi:hypothetical protein